MSSSFYPDVFKAVVGSQISYNVPYDGHYLLTKGDNEIWEDTLGSKFSSQEIMDNIDAVWSAVEDRKTVDELQRENVVLRNQLDLVSGMLKNGSSVDEVLKFLN